MPLAGRFNAAFGAAPRHDGGFRRQSAFQDLVPADELVSVRGEESLDAADKVTLQFMIVLEAFACLRRGALSAHGPPGLGGFVSADMNVRSREQLHHFREHTLQEGEDGVLRAIDVVEHTPGHGRLERTTGAGKLGIGRERGK